MLFSAESHVLEICQSSLLPVLEKNRQTLHIYCSCFSFRHLLLRCYKIQLTRPRSRATMPRLLLYSVLSRSLAEFPHDQTLSKRANIPHGISLPSLNNKALLQLINTTSKIILVRSSTTGRQLSHLAQRHQTLEDQQAGATLTSGCSATGPRSLSLMVLMFYNPDIVENTI